MSRGLTSLTSLSSFFPSELLAQGELTAILGRFAWQPSGEQAIVKLTTQSPAPPDIASLRLHFRSHSGAEYCYYHAVLPLLRLVLSPSLRPAYAVEVIAPASEKQIARARAQPSVLITESE
ncbi:MAG: hypothetical protein SGPRY_001301 [Prymnesium sp.]